MKHPNKHTSKILKLGVAGILFFSSFTFIEAKNPEPIKANTPISNTSVMKAPQNLSANFFQSLKTAISKIQPAKTLTTTPSATAGSFTVEGDTTGYSYTESEQGNFALTFSKSGNYKITGDGNEVTNQTIAVGSNFEGIITLENVNITSTVASPFFVDNTAKLTIDLKGNNKLSTTSQKNATIDFSNATGDAHLTITSIEDGSLDCNNKGSSAAIGGGEGSSGNNITIAGGKITASSSFGAGIGSGRFGAANNINVTGGIITIKSKSGASIGSGDYANASNIEVSGGTLIIESLYGACIGCGSWGDASNIKISGGTITATSDWGVGIGSGYDGDADNINITGGTITANSNTGAGIGCGNYGSAKNINIAGGTVTAISTLGSGIGSGEESHRGDSDNIIISNGSVKANSINPVPTNSTNNVFLAKLENQLGINKVWVDGNEYTRNGNHYNEDAKDYSDDAFYLYLEGGINHIIASKGKRYMAIWDDVQGQFNVRETNAGDFMVFDKDDNIAESGFTYDDNILSIDQSGDYTVTGNPNIISKEIIKVADNFVGSITIDNVDIDVSKDEYKAAFEVNSTANFTLKLKNKNTLKSGRNRAGLQFCDANNTTSGNLVITSIDGEGETSGNLYAVGGFFGAGIGGFSKQLVNNITIQGGTIEAIAGDCAAAIGGGDFGAANNITITGGIVKALGNEQGSTGIGGGRNGTGENITISGGDVTAKGSLGAGIGGGFKYDKACIGKDITISGGNVNAFSENGAGIGGGFNCLAENITITGGTVTAKGGLAFDIGGSSAQTTGNIEISGGSVKGTLGCVPTDGKGHNVYLAKLENQPNIDEVKVDTDSLKREGNHIDDNGNYTDNAFYMYLTGNNHTVTSDEVQHGARWNSIDGFNWITESSYNLTIPASINLNNDNALEISIDNVALVDTTKEVNVKVSNSTDIIEGKLKLKRENGMENQITTSLVSFDKDGNDLVNKGSNLFTVEDMGNDSKTLYFNKPISPTGDLILAGNYTGIINFEVSID